MASTFSMASLQAALPAVGGVAHKNAATSSGRVGASRSWTGVRLLSRTPSKGSVVALQAFSGLRTENPLQLRSGEWRIVACIFCSVNLVCDVGRTMLFRISQCMFPPSFWRLQCDGIFEGLMEIGALVDFVPARLLGSTKVRVAIGFC